MENKIESARATKDITGNLEATSAETLLLFRRRRGWSQARAAKHYKLPYFTYKMAEYGKLTSFEYPKINLGKLGENEECYLFRKRSGKTQETIASAIGCSKYWIYLQEIGKVPCTRLLEFWNN
jgi:hypothetical protein